MTTLPPSVLADAIQDRITPATGRLIASAPVAPCLDCGAPLGPVRSELSIYWCETCSHRYRNGAGKLLTEKMDARIKRYEDERNAREAKWNHVQQ